MGEVGCEISSSAMSSSPREVLSSVGFPIIRATDNIAGKPEKTWILRKDCSRVHNAVQI